MYISTQVVNLVIYLNELDITWQYCKEFLSSLLKFRYTVYEITGVYCVMEKNEKQET